MGAEFSKGRTRPEKALFWDFFPALVGIWCPDLEQGRAGSGRTLAMQADYAYNAGMVQYTIRNVPKDLDQALRRTARDQGKSLNQVAVESLQAALGVSEGSGKRRDLSDLVGAGRIDSAVLEALDDQRRIDPDLWE